MVLVLLATGVVAFEVLAVQSATARWANRLTWATLTVPGTEQTRRAAQSALLIMASMSQSAMSRSDYPGGNRAPLVKPPSRFSRRFRRDPLSKYRAVTGVRARIRWWERGRSLLGLAFMVVLLGMALAAVLLLLAMGFRVGLELIIE